MFANGRLPWKKQEAIIVTLPDDPFEFKVFKRHRHTEAWVSQPFSAKAGKGEILLAPVLVEGGTTRGTGWSISVEDGKQHFAMIRFSGFRFSPSLPT
jgi:hypothetical protein